MQEFYNVPWLWQPPYKTESHKLKQSIMALFSSKMMGSSLCRVITGKATQSKAGTTGSSLTQIRGTGKENQQDRKMVAVTDWWGRSYTKN